MKENIAVEDSRAMIELSQKSDIFNEIINIDLNNEEIGAYASKLAVFPEIRENLGFYLKELVRLTPRIIMEGRDIGTVVAPNAES